MTNHKFLKIIRKILVPGLILCGANAHADQQTAKISGYIPSVSNGKHIFVFQLQNNYIGGCNVTGRFAIDSSALSFQDTEAAVMAAFHTQSDVTVAYNQTCNSLGNAWDATYVCVGNIPC